MYKENYAKTMCYGWEKLFKFYKIERDNSRNQSQWNYWDNKINHAAKRIAEWFCLIPMYE